MATLRERGRVRGFLEEVGVNTSWAGKDAGIQSHPQRGLIARKEEMNSEYGSSRGFGKS
jgi:hypothetical protein